MALIALGLIHILLCLKWGDWKNWRAYYSTILFYIVADFNHMILLTEKELWVIGGFWNDTLADYFIALIIAPCVIILYLSNYPKKTGRKALYVGAFVLVYSVVDYIAYLCKSITYYNGWNIKWTIMLYVLIFVLLRLHQKYPLRAWLLFIAMTVIVIVIFKISLTSLSLNINFRGALCQIYSGIFF